MLSNKILNSILSELGVEKDEVFLVEGHEFKINRKGCLTKYSDSKWDTSNVLDKLLKGEYKIKKLPFKPKINQKYYACVLSELLYGWDIFTNDESDQWYKKHNIIFETKEEAINKTKEILKLLKEEA